MKDLRIFSNLLLGLALVVCVSCATDQGCQVPAARAAGPTPLPQALQRAAYEAPEWDAQTMAAYERRVDASTDMGPAAQVVPTLNTVPVSTSRPLSAENAKVSMDQNRWSADGQRGPIVGQAAPMALQYVGGAPAQEGTSKGRRQITTSQLYTPVKVASSSPLPVVPQPPSATRRGSYEPRADFSAFEPHLVTDSRVPRAAPTSAAPTSVIPAPVVPAPLAPKAIKVSQKRLESAPKAAQPVVPVKVAAIPAPTPTKAVSAPASEFEGSTVSVMPAAAKQAARQPIGRYALHLASYRQPLNVAAGWSLLLDRHGDVLEGLSARGHPVSIPGKGDFIRLLVGPFQTPEDAKALCTALSDRDEYCKVMPFKGAPV
ncbi:MAG: SPOR domain-containing protein [Pseudomonadota bacterium]